MCGVLGCEQNGRARIRRELTWSAMAWHNTVQGHGLLKAPAVSPPSAVPGIIQGTPEDFRHSGGAVQEPASTSK